MSGYDYRSKSGYADGSHSDYVKGRPIISYDAGTGTRTYATRIESHVGGSYKYPTSQVKVDPLMEKYGRPREVEDFITQLLDQVNGAPDLATSPNPGPNRGRRSSPVKMYPTREYDDFAVKSKIFGYHGDPYSHWDRSSGRVYDQPPQWDDVARNNRHSDSYHMKPDASKDYEAPKKWERSPPPVDDPPYHQYMLKDHESPKNQWGNSSIKPHTLKDHEVPKKQRDKSSSYIYDDYVPKTYPVDMSKDHGGTDSRWGNSVGKPRSTNKYGTPNSHRWSSYEQPPAAGYAGGASKNHEKPQSPHNYEFPSYHHKRSSSPLHHHPPNWNTSKVPNSKWDNTLMKPQSPNGHGAPSNQWERSSGPIHNHPPPTKSTMPSVPNNRWNSSIDSQSPKGHKVLNNQWDGSSSPASDQPPPNKSSWGVPNAPSNQWSNSMNPQSPTRYGVSNKQWNRSSSPARDQSPPIKSSWGDRDVPSNRWSNSMNPRSPTRYGTSNKQWDRSSSPADHQPPPPIKSSWGDRGVPSNRWSNSMNPQSPTRYGTSNKHWDRSSSPIYDHPPPTKGTGGIHNAPSSGWTNSVNPQSPKGHRVPNNQWDRSSSPIYDHPPPTKSSIPNVPGSPHSRWGNSLTKPQSPNGYEVANSRWDRSSSPVYEHPTPTMSTNPNMLGSRGGNSLMKPLSPNSHRVPNNQWDSYHDQPTPTKNIEGVHSVPSSGRGGNSLIKPQNLNDPEVPSNQWDRLPNPVRDNPLATSDTRGLPDAPNNRWGNSLMKRQSPRDNGAPNNQRDTSSSPSMNHPPPTRSTGGLPNDRWGSSSVKPQSPKGHGVPNNQSNGSPSSVHDPPLPSKNIGGVPSGIPNSPTKSESPKAYGLPHDLGNKQSRFVPDDLSQSGKLGKVSNNQWSDVAVKPESPKGHNQWDRSSSPMHDHPPPTRNTFGVPNSKVGYSPVNPQSPKNANSPYDEQIGNADNYNNQVNKPDDYSYDRQPEKHGASNNGMKPDSYYSTPPKVAPVGATQRSSASNNHPTSQSKLSYPSSVRPK